MEPLNEFFRGYPWFEYDPHESASAQFHRLYQEAGWRRNDPEQVEAWEDYLAALVGQFNSSYGSDDDDLDAWHELLVHVGIAELPDSTGECKRVIQGKFINLVDLVDARGDPTKQIKHFATEVELSEYTLSEHKIFPRNHVDAGSLLKYLLRKILSPDPNRRDDTITDEGRRKGQRIM